MMKSRDCSIKVNKSNIFTVVKRRQKQPLRGVLQNSCFTKRFSFCSMFRIYRKNSCTF